jgi:hypothetical protein
MFHVCNYAQRSSRTLLSDIAANSHLFNTTCSASKSCQCHHFLFLAPSSLTPVPTPQSMVCPFKLSSHLPLFLDLVTVTAQPNLIHHHSTTMQVVSYSLTHRGRSASRTRARWQPYASIQPSMRTPSSAYLDTPVSSSSSSVSTPAPALHHSICDPDTKPLLPSWTNTLQLSKDIHKHKYVTGLVCE